VGKYSTVTDTTRLLRRPPSVMSCQKHFSYAALPHAFDSFKLRLFRRNWQGSSNEPSLPRGSVESPLRPQSPKRAERHQRSILRCSKRSLAVREDLLFGR
jgi:hypothetical protein